MQVQAYLTFAGRCEEALKFYKTHSGAEVTTLMADDGMGTEERAEFKGVTLALSAASDADTRRLFDALSDGGSVQMPLMTTFLTSSFGMLTDGFGVPWMVMTESSS